MTIGPVEYIIVGFPGNKFNGEIAPELAKLVDSDTIRVLDLVFIMKDADGNVEHAEFEDHDDVALFNALEGEVGGLISEEDIQYAAAELEPNSSAALLIWEDLWVDRSSTHCAPPVPSSSKAPASLTTSSRQAESELAAAG